MRGRFFISDKRFFAPVFAILGLFELASTVETICFPDVTAHTVVHAKMTPEDTVRSFHGLRMFAGLPRRYWTAAEVSTRRIHRGKMTEMPRSPPICLDSTNAPPGESRRTKIVRMLLSPIPISAALSFQATSKGIVTRTVIPKISPSSSTVSVGVRPEMHSESVTMIDRIEAASKVIARRR